jgi:serine/threonine protein kinase
MCGEADGPVSLIHRNVSKMSDEAHEDDSLLKLNSAKIGNLVHEVDLTTVHDDLDRKCSKDEEARRIEGHEWEISSKNLVIGKELGRGQYGRVHHCTWQGTNVAVKFLFNASWGQDEADDKFAKETFAREIRAIARLHHPHLAQFLGFVARESGLNAELETGIVMEYCTRGPLDEYIKPDREAAPRFLSFATKRRFCHEMALALAYLHNRQPLSLIHRDIKPSNWLLTASLRVKLADFGLSILAERTGNRDKDSSLELVDAELLEAGTVGTSRYLAPEALAPAEPGSCRVRISTAVDIFSVAMVYYFVFQRCPPSLARMGVKTAGDHMKAIRENRRPVFTGMTPKHVRTIIERAWDTDPVMRPRALELAEAWQAATKFPNGKCGAIMHYFGV